ncbi:MAG: peptidoglycan bridge formation protein FemAB [Treponema sp. RIFOXYC1_FULL_61_9]|nr:MAG: peptidoglycan bridge formation protein FemAB [Treponema sp. RIFOXYC1_FULL_61_9]
MPPAFRGVAPTDLARFDAARSFLQSGFWGSFKARFGWNARAFLVDWGEGGKLPLLAIRRKLGFLGSFAYVPWGPELPDGLPVSDAERSEALAALAAALKELLPPDTAFIRFDPPWTSVGDGVDAPVLLCPFRRSGADVQPPDTVIVGLGRGEEEILAAMKPKWRYNVRLADRKGVSVSRADAAGINAFYELYLRTAKRDRIAIHGKDYYAALFAHAAEARAVPQDLRLYLAEFGGQPIAAIIVLLRGEEATYLYGASSDSMRQLMPAYALQWRAMRDARDAGCLRYDLFGIPPRADGDHPMAGLYRFKTGFGGEIVHRPGSWDFPYKSLPSNLFSFAESARKKVRDMRKSRRKTGAAEGER